MNMKRQVLLDFFIDLVYIESKATPRPYKYGLGALQGVTP